MVLVNFLARIIVVRGELPDFPMSFGQMKVVAGYYTADGKYLGGLPKADTLSREIYDCQDYYFPENGTANATLCLQWEANEAAGDVFQVGECECRSVVSEAYCSVWSCNQVKRGVYCDGGCYVESSTDAILCECDLEHQSGLFCDAWSCKQIDSKARVEYEAYQCLRTSPSGHCCEAWNGNVTASDEIEVVACECKQEWQGEDVCSYWECEELGLNTCASYRRESWCNLGVSVGVGGGIGFLGVVMVCYCICAIASPCYSDNQCATIWLFVGGVCGLVWCCVWAVGVVIWGGADGAKYVGIMWGAPIFAALSFLAVRSRIIMKRGRDNEEGRKPNMNRTTTGIAKQNGRQK